MNPGEVLALVAVVAGFVVILRPVATALARRLGGEPRGSGVDAEQLDDVRAAVQEVQRELGELSERMDFAERLLAKQRDAELPRPRS